MDQNHLGSKNTLSELNEFSSKIEFFLSKTRNVITCEKSMDIIEYIKLLEKIVNEHEHNLSLCLSMPKLKLFSDSNEIYNSKIYREIYNSQVAK